MLKEIGCDCEYFYVHNKNLQLDPRNYLPILNFEQKKNNLKRTVFTGLASTYPEPEDKRKWLEGQLYNFNYESSMPITWSWPQPTPMKTRAVKPTKLTEKEETC